MTQTNWLDPEQVRAELPFMDDEGPWYVLEAIAALPEPAPDDADNTGESMYLYACASYFRRIWLVARIVTGKERP